MDKHNFAKRITKMFEQGYSQKSISNDSRQIRITPNKVKVKKRISKDGAFKPSTFVPVRASSSQRIVQRNKRAYSIYSHLKNSAIQIGHSRSREIKNNQQIVPKNRKKINFKHYAKYKPKDFLTHHQSINFITRNQQRKIYRQNTAFWDQQAYRQKVQKHVRQLYKAHAKNYMIQNQKKTPTYPLFVKQYIPKIRQINTKQYISQSPNKNISAYSTVYNTIKKLQ